MSIIGIKNKIADKGATDSTIDESIFNMKCIIYSFYILMKMCLGNTKGRDLELNFRVAASFKS